MKRWYNKFNRGRHSLTDEFRKGHPKSVVGPEDINAVQKLIMQDRHVKYTVENVCDFTMHYSTNCNVKLQSEYCRVELQ